MKIGSGKYLKYIRGGIKNYTEKVELLELLSNISLVRNQLDIVV